MPPFDNGSDANNGMSNSYNDPTSMGGHRRMRHQGGALFGREDSFQGAGDIDYYSQGQSLTGQAAMQQMGANWGLNTIPPAVLADIDARASRFADWYMSNLVSTSSENPFTVADSGILEAAEVETMVGWILDRLC